MITVILAGIAVWLCFREPKKKESKRDGKVTQSSNTNGEFNPNA